jgi:hypothetical protein
MEQVFPDWEQDEVMDAFFSYSVEEMEKSRENVPALAFWEKLFHWMMM